MICGEAAHASKGWTIFLVLGTCWLFVVRTNKNICSKKKPQFLFEIEWHLGILSKIQSSLLFPVPHYHRTPDLEKQTASFIDLPVIAVSKLPLLGHCFLRPKIEQQKGGGMG